MGIWRLTAIEHVVVSLHCRVSGSITPLGGLDWSLFRPSSLILTGTRPCIDLCITARRSGIGECARCSCRKLNLNGLGGTRVGYTQIGRRVDPMG
jgi:hypothetical protein